MTDQHLATIRRLRGQVAQLRKTLAEVNGRTKPKPIRGDVNKEHYARAVRTLAAIAGMEGCPHASALAAAALTRITRNNLGRPVSSTTSEWTAIRGRAVR